MIYLNPYSRFRVPCHSCEVTSKHSLGTSEPYSVRSSVNVTHLKQTRRCFHLSCGSLLSVLLSNIQPDDILRPEARIYYHHKQCKNKKCSCIIGLPSKTYHWPPILPPVAFCPCNCQPGSHMIPGASAGSIFLPRADAGHRSHFCQSHQSSSVGIVMYP